MNQRLKHLSVTVAVAMSVALGSAGCSGSDETVVGHWVLPTSADWKEAKPLGDPWTAAYMVNDMEIQVAGSFSRDPVALAALSRLDLPASLKLPDYKPTRTDQIKIPDANEKSWVRFYRYTENGKPMEGAWIVSSQFPYPASAVISISGSKVDPGFVEQLINDVRFIKNQEEGPTQQPSPSKATQSG